MATIADDNEQNQIGQGPAQPKATAGTSAPTGSGTGVGVGTAPAAQVQQNQAPQNNNGYTDVASYLNANQQGGTQLGQSVANNLTTGYNTTKSGIDTSVNNANSQINSGYIPENTQLIQQVAANPTAAAADSGQLSAFQGQLNDTYGGPTSWADYGTQQGNVNQATQNANLLNTPGGNNVLIQQVENQTNPGQTSQGVNALDTMLFQGNPNAVATAQTAAQPYSGLNDYLNTANTGITGNIGTAQTNAAQTAQDALNAFTGSNGTLTNLNNTINQTTASDLAAAQAQEAAIKADLGNLYGGQALNTTPGTITGYGGAQSPWYNTTNYTVGNLSPQDLQALGMTQDQWNALQSGLQTAGTSTAHSGRNFGANTGTTQMDLNSYLSQQDPTQAVTNATTATPEQYAQMAAIQQLLGAKNPTGNAINPLNSAQASTYNPNGLNQFNYNAALGDVGNFNTNMAASTEAEKNALVSGADLAHAQSQHTGGVLGGLKQDITHPLSTIASVVNPIQWGSDIQNIAGGKQVNPTGGVTANNIQTQAGALALAHMLLPQTAALGATGAGAGAATTGEAIAGAAAAHGGEVKDDGTIETYLNKNKKVK